MSAINAGTEYLYSCCTFSCKLYKISCSIFYFKCIFNSKASKKEIRAALKARLPFHMIPSYFVLLNRFAYSLFFTLYPINHFIRLFYFSCICSIVSFYFIVPNKGAFLFINSNYPLQVNYLIVSTPSALFPGWEL